MVEDEVVNDPVVTSVDDVLAHPGVVELAHGADVVSVDDAELVLLDNGVEPLDVKELVLEDGPVRVEVSVNVLYDIPVVLTVSVEVKVLDSELDELVLPVVAVEVGPVTTIEVETVAHEPVELLDSLKLKEEVDEPVMALLLVDVQPVLVKVVVIVLVSTVDDDESVITVPVLVVSVLLCVSLIKSIKLWHI